MQTFDNRNLDAPRSTGSAAFAATNPAFAVPPVAQIVTLSGDVTGSGSTAITVTVVGIKGHTVPTLGATAGGLRWNGTTWVLDTSAYLTGITGPMVTTALGFTPEPALGSPGTSGWILSSTTGGVRSWIAPWNPAAPGTIGGTTPGLATFSTATATTIQTIPGTGSSRQCVLSNGALTMQAGTGGWSEGLFFYNNAQTSFIGGFGCYGSVDTPTYHFIGGSYSSPLLKVDQSGNTTITGGFLSGPVTSAFIAQNSNSNTAVRLQADSSNTSSVLQVTNYNNSTSWGTITFTNGKAAFSMSVYANAGIDIGVAGKGLAVAEGSNAKQGVATLVAGTVTVANTSVTATSRIFLTRQGFNSSTALGELAVPSRVAGTSFTITSYTAGAVTTQAGDLSTIAYEIFEVG